MLILGISNSLNSSACLFKNGKLLMACSEEHFSRKKNDDAFPEKSINYILKKNNIKNFNQIDQIAYSWSKGCDDLASKNLIKRYKQELVYNKKNIDIFLNRIRVEKKRDNLKKQEFLNWAYEKKVFDKVKLYYHHEGHALSSILMSNFTSGYCITADARGDFESLAIWYFNLKRKKYLEKIFSVPTNDSLGYFYGRITGLVGFRPNRHEGKITGLAANGNSKKCIKLMMKMINIKNGTIIANNGPYFRPYFTNYSKKLIKEIKKFKKADLAAAAQKHLETIILKLIKLKIKSKKFNLCFAGGVAANVKLNQKIKEYKKVKKLFIQPQMNDGGLCIGAAAAVSFENNIKIVPIKNYYLGFNNNENEINLIKKKFKLLEVKGDLISNMVKFLKKNYVLGVVRGKMEFGPRALLNRSIVYKTTDISCNNWLNKRLNRTEFMPFAPFTIPELAKKSFKKFNLNDQTLWYMTSTINCTNLFKKMSPAVCHVDNTARPQIIFKEQNPLFFNLMKKWNEQTGELSLINTSFNIHEEPIIRTYEDGAKELSKGVIDIILLENKLFVSSKKNYI